MLMQPIKCLNYTVVREPTTEARDEAGIQPVHKPLADTDWELPLA
jgi:hypothetical protein